MLLGASAEAAASAQQEASSRGSSARLMRALNQKVKIESVNSAAIDDLRVSVVAFVDPNSAPAPVPVAGVSSVIPTGTRRSRCPVSAAST